MTYVTHCDPMTQSTPTKVIVAAFGADAPALLDDKIRSAAAAAGATSVQVNAPDEAFAGAMSIGYFAEPITGLISVWGEAPAEELATAVRDALDVTTYAWEVEETVVLNVGNPGDGSRVPGLANIALLRVPADMAYEDWRSWWQGPHSQIACDTQATFGYVQNRVVRQLAGEEREVAAIVEELFPEAGASDPHAFYGTGGDDAELGRRLGVLLDSCAKFGASTDLDLVNTARRTFDL